MIFVCLLSSYIVLGLIGQELGEKSHHSNAEKNAFSALQTSGDVTSGKQELKTECENSEVSLSITTEPLIGESPNDNLKNSKDDFSIQDLNTFLDVKMPNQTKAERTNNGNRETHQVLEARNLRAGQVSESQETADLITGSNKQSVADFIWTGTLKDLIFIPGNLPDPIINSPKVTYNSFISKNLEESTKIPPNMKISTLFSQNITKSTAFPQSIKEITQQVTEVSLILQNTSYSKFNENNTTNIAIDPDNKTDLTEEDLNNTFIVNQFLDNNVTNGTRTSYQGYMLNLAGLYIPFCNHDSSCSGRCGGDYEGGKYKRPKGGFALAQDNFNNGPPLQSQTFNSLNAEPIPGRLCNCDDKCVIYGDCCADVFHECWNITTPESVKTFIVDTRHNNLLNESHDNLVNLLRQHPDNADLIVDAMYIHFATCLLKDRSDYRMKLFVSECPERAGRKLKNKCQNNTSLVLPPVTAILGASEVTFMNEFCATCHGVHKEEFNQWRAFLVCSSDANVVNSPLLTLVDIDLIITLGLCNVSYSDTIKRNQQRLCFSSEKLTPIYHEQLLESVANNICTITDMLMCESYYFYKDIYRNPHCQLCLASSDGKHNTTNFRYKLNQNKNYSVPCKVIVDKEDATPNFPSVFMIMDLSGKHSGIKEQGTPKFEKEKSVCLDTEVFDQVAKKCKTLICPTGKDAHKGKCRASQNDHFQQKTQEFENSWSQLDVLIQTEDVGFSCENVTKEFLETALTNVVVNSVLVSHDQFLFTGHDVTKKPSDAGYREWCADSYNTNMTEQLTSVTLNLSLAKNLDLKNWNQLKTISQALSLKKYKMTIINMDWYLNSVCSIGKVGKRIDSFSVEDKDGLGHAVINSTFYPLLSLGYRIRVEKENDDVYFSESVMICEETKLFMKANCNVIGYIRNETSKSQLIAQYGEDNVDIQEHTVFVCSRSQHESNTESVTDNIPFMILSWTLTGMSVLCLIVMLTIYYLFPELCTLPGKLTASLAATMLLTHLLISLGTFKFKHEYACPVAAAFTHFVVLAQFGWMSAIAVNMALTFGPNSILRIKSMKSDKTFFRYNVVVWGLSLITVMTAVALDFLYNETFSSNDDFQCNSTTSTNSSKPSTTCSVFYHSLEFPHYGDKYCVWFAGSMWTTLAFVVAPFSLTYAINVVCFVITMIGIHKSTQRAKKIGKTSLNRIQCLIFIKMSTAMGFAWVLDIPAGFVDINSVAGYIFATCILLQGVFLFLAFMANKRVFGLVRERILSWELTTGIVSDVTTGQ